MEVDSVAYLGATDDGDSLIIGLADEEGVEHELRLHHSKMSRLLTSVLTAGQVAVRNRTQKTPMGADMPQLHNLMRVGASDAQLLPDGNVAVRLVVEDVPMDLCLTPAVAQALWQTISSLAPTSTPPVPPLVAH